VAFPAVQQLHPQVIRYDLSWARTAPRKPADATNPDDPAYDWSLVDQVVIRADALGVPVLLTIEVTPRWAGGGTGNKPPVNMATLQAFSYAAATRYSGQHIVPSTGQVLPAVTRWEAWNEPNTTSHLTPQYSCRCASAVPVAPTIYAKILNAIYKGIHSAGTHAGIKEIVAGGATKPNYSGPKTFEPAVAPLRFLLLLGKKHPPLDVYSHHPYRTDVGKKAGQLPGPDSRQPTEPISLVRPPPAVTTNSLLASAGVAIRIDASATGWMHFMRRYYPRRARAHFTPAFFEHHMDPIWRTPDERRVTSQAVGSLQVGNQTTSGRPPKPRRIDATSKGIGVPWRQSG